MSIEVELKALATAEQAIYLLTDSRLTTVAVESQLNHYFTGKLTTDNLSDLTAYVSDFSEELFQELIDYVNQNAKISVRTRAVNEETDLFATSCLLVCKISLNDTTSENGTVRKELNIEMRGNIHDIDDILQLGGTLQQQAKWRRDRVELQYEDVTVCVDRNAGYGYIIEVERMIEDESAIEATTQDLQMILAEFGLKELPQKQLEEMFNVYNDNWLTFYYNNTTFADYPEYQYLLTP